MNKFLSISLPILFFGLSGETTEIPAWAKEKAPVKINYYLGVGTSFPTGALADNWKQGFHGFGRLDFAATPKLSIWAGVDYHYFSFEDQPDTSVKGANFSSFNFIGDLKVNLASSSESFNPYFFGGAGLAVSRVSDSTYRIYGDTLVNRGSVTYETATNALIEVGVGLEYKFFFIHCRYLNTMTNVTTVNYVPVTLGVRIK